MSLLTSLSLIGSATLDPEPLIALEEVLPTLTSLKKLCVYRNKIVNLSALGQVASQMTELKLSPSSLTKENRAFILSAMPQLKKVCFWTEESDETSDSEAMFASFFQELKNRGVEPTWETEPQFFPSTMSWVL
jgi:hypothetical protein